MPYQQTWRLGMDRKRAAFTLIELVATMSVATILLALIVPAVQSARESGRTIQCASHLHQLGIATQAFISAKNHFPISYVQNPSRPHDLVPNTSYQAQLLPYLDQQELFGRLVPEVTLSMEQPHSEMNAFALSTSVPVFVCPSDSVPPGGNSYRVNHGTTTGRHETWRPKTPPPSPFEEGLHGWGHSIKRPVDVCDGLSNTVWISERLVGDGNPDRYTPYRDLVAVGGHLYAPRDAYTACSQISAATRHNSFLGWSWLPKDDSQTQYNHVLTPNSSIPDCVDHWADHGVGQGAVAARSFHAGGVNAVFADGSRKFINEEIDLRVWRALGTSCGGEFVNDF